MSGKDLIFIDLDGTLIDYRVRAFNTFLKVGEGFSINEIGFRKYIDMRLCGNTNYDILSEFSNQRVDREKFELLWKKYIEDSGMLSLDKLFPDSKQWLSEHKDNFVLALCTSRKNESNLEMQLRSLEVIEFFDDIIVSRISNDKTTAVENYLKGKNLQSECQFFVGDTLTDMLVGNSIGAKTCFVERGFTRFKDLKEVNLFSHGKVLPNLSLQIAQ
jgi:phosphoglycolate phosphatase-like HAD superfamily hydrolase